MTDYFTRIPPLALFVICFIPLAFMSGNTKLWCFINIIVFTFYFIWIYSITKKLLDKNKYDTTIKLNKFRIQLVLTNFYIVALSIYFALTYPNVEEPKWMLLIIIIGQFFLFWNFIYLIRFVAKAIATIELKRECHFPDYLGNIVLLFFFHSL